MTVTQTVDQTADASYASHQIWRQRTWTFDTASDLLIVDTLGFDVAAAWMTAYTSGTLNMLSSADAEGTVGTLSGAFGGAAGTNQGVYRVGNKTAANGEAWIFTVLPRYLVLTGIVGTVLLELRKRGVYVK